MWWDWLMGTYRSPKTVKQFRVFDPAAAAARTDRLKLTTADEVIGDNQLGEEATTLKNKNR
jgi:hypothetical protein